MRRRQKQGQTKKGDKEYGADTVKRGRKEAEEISASYVFLSETPKICLSQISSLVFQIFWNRKLKAKIEKRKLLKDPQEKIHMQAEVSKHADKGDNQSNEEMCLYPVEEAGELKEGRPHT